MMKICGLTTGVKEGIDSFALSFIFDLGSLSFCCSPCLLASASEDGTAVVMSVDKEAGRQM